MAHSMAASTLSTREGAPTGTDGLATLGVAALLGVAGYCALFVAPNERTLGLIQRIFYFYVPSAWTGFVAFLISFIASIAYLRVRAPKWDWLAVSSAECGGRV